jgi:hypothetical protein
MREMMKLLNPITTSTLLRIDMPKGTSKTLKLKGCRKDSCKMIRG